MYLESFSNGSLYCSPLKMKFYKLKRKFNEKIRPVSASVVSSGSWIIIIALIWADQSYQ